MSQPPTLRQQRYIVLVRQLLTELGSQTKVGRKLGVSQGMISQVLDGKKRADEPSIEKARQRMRLSHRFFADESLGDEPLYEAFVGAADWPDDSEGYPIVEEYIRSRPDLSADEARELRGIRHSNGPTWVTEEYLDGVLFGIRTRNKLSRPRITE